MPALACELPHTLGGIVMGFSHCSACAPLANAGGGAPFDNDGALSVQPQTHRGQTTKAATAAAALRDAPNGFAFVE